MLCLLLNGCSFWSTPLSKEEQSQKLAIAIEKAGYANSYKLNIDSHREVWQHDGVELEVVMTAPVGAERYPLIIYLPSLGENAQAGKLWRESWAKAGYAVLSLQAMDIGQALKGLDSGLGYYKHGESVDEEGKAEDEPGAKPGFAAKRARSARNSELRYLGHEYFAVSSLKKRMQQLFWAYEQLRVRVKLQQPFYANADLSKVVLAGYDLGAQTVAAAIGENFMAELPESDTLKPVAALLLSPSIDLAEGNVRSRFQKLNLPMLVMTSGDDNDPYAISSASVREAVWEYAPSGDKYLLLLAGNVHQLLTGSDMGGRIGFGLRDTDTNRSGEEGDVAGKMLQLGGQGHARRANGSEPGNGFGEDRVQKRVDLGYTQVAAVISTSTAFLDAVVNKDEFARFWMKDKANKWLDKAGTLKIR